MHSVEVTGGRALRELRRMLGILRTDDRPSDLRDGAQAVVFAHESGVVRPSPTNEPAAGA